METIQRRAALAAAGLALAGPAAAQAPGAAAWPNRPIRLIIPFAAGAGADAAARIVGGEMQRILGVPVVPENRTGGSGSIGAELVRQSSADGYTLLATAATHVLTRYVMRNPPFDPKADFTPIARYTETPLILVCHPGSVPPGGLMEAVAAIRANPSRFSFGLGGVGAPSHLAVLEFMRAVGVNLTTVVYRGSAPGLTDLIAGQIQLMIDPGALPHVQGGRLKALATLGARRHPALPDLPTAAEAGMPGLERSSWFGIWGPKGVPDPLVRRLNAAINELPNADAAVARLRDVGLFPVRSTPEEFARFIDAEEARSGETLRAVNFQPE